MTEIEDPEQRIVAIAKSYAANPEDTIIVSPDNASRQAINLGDHPKPAIDDRVKTGHREMA